MRQEEAVSTGSTPAIGGLFRERRKARGLTLEQLAAIAGISKSMVSHIERGEVNPSFAVLWRLTRALGMSLSELTPLKAPLDQSHPQHLSAAETPELWNVDKSCRMRILSPPELVGTTQWYEIVFAPGGTLMSEPHPKGAWEHLTSLTGNLIVTSGGGTFTVGPGATMRYPADVEHSIRNPGKDPARALLVSILVNGLYEAAGLGKRSDRGHAP